MKINVDADVVKYRCGFAGEKTHYEWWHEDDIEEIETPEGEALYKTRADAEPIAVFPTAKEAKAWLAEVPEEMQGKYVRVPRKKLDDLSHVLHSTKMVMQTIQDKFPDGNIVCFFSCPTPENWRTKFFPEYKANRPDRKPFYADEITQYLYDRFECYTEEGYEADDLICREWHEDHNSVTVTIDKDMDQIPGTHFNWVKDEVYVIDENRAKQVIAIQSLAGDNIDNIPGLPGIGWKKAEDRLAGASADLTLDEIVLSEYLCFYSDPNKAAYWAKVNNALVTLPTSDAHRDELIKGVEDAWSNCEEAAETV